VQILLLTVGRPKERCLAQLVEAYLARLGSWKAEWCAVRPSHREPVDARLREEATRLRRHILPDDYVVVLDERGEEFDSVRFARWLGQRIEDARRLVFVVGGAEGLSPELRSGASLQLRLSALTLQHDLALLLLSEQIYRAYTILAGRPYHRGA
jgi:23S rRNA (pseudouridine1915-N3)-methyltransferase